MLHHVEYVNEKLRGLEMDGVSGNLNDQKLRELRAMRGPSMQLFRWPYRLLAGPFARTAGSSLRQLGEGLEAWASPPAPATFAAEPQRQVYEVDASGC